MMLSIFACSTSRMLLIHNPILEIYFTQILHVCLIVLFNADPNLKTVLFMPKANFDLLRILSNLKSQFAAVRVNIDWCFICFFHELYLLVHGNTFPGCFSVNTVMYPPLPTSAENKFISILDEASYQKLSHFNHAVIFFKLP